MFRASNFQPLHFAFETATLEFTVQNCLFMTFLILISEKFCSATLIFDDWLLLVKCIP